MKVGDLVRRREPHGYDIIVEYLIFIGDGLWAGWGKFIDSKGQTGQIQFTDVEAICE